MAKRGAQLKSQYRYLEPQLTPARSSFEYLPDDKEFGDSREGVSLAARRTNSRAALTGCIDYNKVSDDRYFVDLATPGAAALDRQPAAGRAT